MRKSFCFLASFVMAVLFSVAAFAQTVTITGNVRNESSKETVPAVSIRVKGTNNGTYTNSDGEFSISVDKLPVVLVFTSIGYVDQEVSVSDASKPIEVSFKVNNQLGQEVVVAANRTPTRILQSPVTVERMNSNTLRNVAAPNYYEAIANLKGVDVHTASLTFRTVTTRGFVSSGNTRLNQLIDGMDNQAPGLNFSVGSVLGPSDLDVDNVEILSGASSALYGSGGMNGTVLINTKSPFKYQDLSYNIKQGIMHVDGKQRNPAPYYDWSFRYAKAFNNKFAFKIAAQLVKGADWEAEDYRNKQQIGVLSKVVGGNRGNDPNFNGINIYGDETSAGMNGFAYYVQDATRRNILAASGGLLDVINNPFIGANAYFGVPGSATQPGVIGMNPYPTNTQISNWITTIATAGSLPPPAVAALQQMMPFYIGLNRGYFNNASISRTGYEEQLLVDYNTINAKLTAGLHYKINERLEASFNTYFGTGTTVYTGADRYSLRNLKMAQHKLEFKTPNWFVRGYTTQENAGESYNATAVGAFLNEYYSPSSTWFPTYIGTFSEGRRLNGVAGQFPSDIQLHAAARAAADVNRYIPGTARFDSAMSVIKKTPIRKGGALFLDKSDLWAAETQFNISELGHFSDKVEILAGANWKQWVMNSQGTIFADTSARIRINEYGGFIQLKKSLLNDVLTLSASGRYDKQTNFDGRFTPRVTAVIKVAKDNYLRLSYQSAYRFPTNQNQYISLVTGSGVLMGCLPEFQDYYKLNSTQPGYTAASVLAYRAGALSDSSRLVRATFKEVTPETVYSYEIGYKGVIGKKLLIDAYAYYSRYNDFLVNAAVVQSTALSPSGNAYQYGTYSPYTSRNLSYVQNSTNVVKSYGWGIGAEYRLFKGYELYGNVYSDMLKDVAADVVTFFNAPKYRFNVGLRNDNVCHGIGFNVVFKWQDNNYYEGTFVSGTLPYFGWWDAQVSYRPQGTKSTFRVGGTNLGNFYARTGFGSPSVGGLYYISYGYNLF
ncbi:MAG TPA: carboxypeptidase-like regulatory domain-containing protein [Chitinophagaceae bacterium]|nr:carboxypeptidase-like regulatory domain-containing protein [Chitinophagaceae bacterium]